MLNVTFYNLNENNVVQSVKPDLEGIKTLKYADNLFRNSSGETYSLKINTSLIQTSGLFSNTNLEYVDSDLNNLIKSDGLGDAKLIGGTPYKYGLFQDCTSLKKINTKMENVQSACNICSGCTALESFTGNLLNLEMMFSGFNGCPNLSKFDSPLPKLKIAGMQNPVITSQVLEEFVIDLPELRNGDRLFSCPNLSKFTGIVPKLLSGSRMFFRTKLDAASVMYILFSIPNLQEMVAEQEIKGFVQEDDSQYGYDQEEGFINPYQYIYPVLGKAQRISSVGGLHLGIGVSPTEVDGKSVEQQLLEFANEVGFDSWADLKQAFVDKGWTVQFSYNNGDTITYGLRGRTLDTCPIYARLEEVENKEEAEYCNVDKTKYYNIEYCHDTTHPEKFQQFNSLEEACASFEVIVNE